MTDEQVISSKKITIGLILSWTFGILFTLIGITSVFSELIFGIIVLVMAAVLLPPVNKLIDEKWKIHLSGGVKIVVIIVGFIIFGSMNDVSDTTKQKNIQSQNQQEQSALKTEQQKNEMELAEEQIEVVNSNEEMVEKEKQNEVVEEKQGETLSQKNAIRKAKSYLNISGFSKSGLIGQLEFEGFSHEDAVYAADNVGADWNKQAERKAKAYLDMSGFSRVGLRDQLKFEGFTSEQATYGVDAIGL